MELLSCPKPAVAQAQASEVYTLDFACSRHRSRDQRQSERQTRRCPIRTGPSHVYHVRVCHAEPSLREARGQGRQGSRAPGVFSGPPNWDSLECWIRFFDTWHKRTSSCAELWEPTYQPDTLRLQRKPALHQAQKELALPGPRCTDVLMKTRRAN